MFYKLAIVVSAALAVITPTLAQTSCTRNYTVVQGDICDWISKSQNVSTYQLAAVNVDIIDSTCSNLIPGANLCLGTPGEDCTETYVVKDTDTCEGIQSQFSVNSTILMQNNPQIDSDCWNLYTGEVLCVAKTVVAPPIPSGFFDNTDDGSIDWIPVPDGSTDDDIPYCDDVN